MKPVFKDAIPVLPSTNVAASLKWWTEVCGFEEVFSHGTPPTYAGIRRDDATLHLAGMADAKLARTVADQTMVRLRVSRVEELYAEFQNRGGEVHPNGSLQTKPWGSKEFAAIDPAGVCVTFAESL